MSIVYKYHVELKYSDIAEIEMPAGAKVLTVQVQHEAVFVWALVDPDCTVKVARRFMALGTGNRPEQEPGRYISTIQLQGGGLVFHMFEQDEPKELSA